MSVWRAPRWLLRTAIAGVLVMAFTDLVLMRRHRVSVAAPPVRETIGLNAEASADGLRLQWDRTSRPIRIADRATLYVDDGSYKTQLDLTSLQLTASSVHYWPKSEAVVFRMDVYTGNQVTSDSVLVPAPRHPAKRSRSDVAVVEKLRPSPFEPVPGTATRPATPLLAISAQLTEPVVEPVVEVARPDPPSTRMGRMLAKIPLIGRWKKHPESTDSK